MKTKFLCSSFMGSKHLFLHEVSLKDKRVGFIPTASDVEEYRDYVDETRDFFREHAQSVQDILLDTVTKERLQSILDEIDILFFSGGNTFYLLSAVQQSGIDELISSYLAKGKYVIGESAGAVIMTPDISYIEEMDDKSVVVLSDTSGMHLVDRPIIPHVASDYLGEAAEKIRICLGDKPYYSLTDEEALFF